MYIGLHVKYPLYLSDFNEDPPSGSQVVQCRWMDRQTDRHEANTLRIFANAPKNASIGHLDYVYVQSH